MSQVNLLSSFHHTRRQVLYEIGLQASLLHPNVMPLWAAYRGVVDNDVHLVMPLAACCLTDMLNRDGFSTEAASLILHDIGSALKYLHARVRTPKD